MSYLRTPGKTSHLSQTPTRSTGKRSRAQYLSPNASPITSKARTPKRQKKSPYTISSLKKLLSPNRDQKKQIRPSANNLSLFSPKYLDTTNHSDENVSFLPPASPLKGNQKLNDNQVKRSVKSIRESVWETVEDEMDGFLFMKYAPLLPANYFKNKPSALPPQSKENEGKLCLVLDLDETLVHCSVDKPTSDYDAKFPVEFGDMTYNVFMKKRPYFKQFLEAVSAQFEVVIYTASQQCYADKLLDLVDRDNKLIHHRLFRHHCVNVEGNYVKDLRVLGRDLNKTVIIDNSPPAFTYQVDNGIPIISWYDQEDDTELMKVIPVLQKLDTLHDVRPAIKKYFSMKKLIKSVRM